MQHALCIQEILLNIFGHCCPPESHWTIDKCKFTADLATLARTCRTFKEPALDVLWSELVDLTPLPRCVPQCYSVSHGCYSFKIRLDETEWPILRSYTRRIWHIRGHANSKWLNPAALIEICGPPITEPLFPNLRSFYWRSLPDIPPVHVAVPSLTSLDVSLGLVFPRTHPLLELLDTVVNVCLNLKQFRIHVLSPGLDSEAINRFIRSIPNLQILECDGFLFDAPTILHLSKLSSLIYFKYTVIPDADWMLSSCSELVFQTLRQLEMKCPLLEPASLLLSRTRLPAMEHLDVALSRNPQKDVLRTYVETVRHVCSPNTLTKFVINSKNPLGIRYSGALDRSLSNLALDDLSPCMMFTNLRHMKINLQWSVDMTDSDLLALASAWPYIQTLSINDKWGWRTTGGGITLHGFSQLLQQCRQLSTLCIAIRTESRVDIATMHRSEGGIFDRPSMSTTGSLLTINLLDSPIQPVDVPMLVTFFVRLGLQSHVLLAWHGLDMEEREDIAMQYRRDWCRTLDKVRGALVPGHTRYDQAVDLAA
ncbi:hypothetical protein JVU11DRAFT_2197 [Chiua virens]|nr:hypothetical protein JVU11DRAFT_2197 [Chiua virens]